MLLLTNTSVLTMWKTCSNYN